MFHDLGQNAFRFCFLVWVCVPRSILSIEQLESPTLVFIAQLKGILTTQRYKYASIFVDQYSDLTFVFLQKRLTSEETVRRLLKGMPASRV